MKKGIALLLSAIMTFSGVQITSLRDVGNALFAALTGVPLTQDAVQDGFLDDLGDEDVARINAGTGYYKNLLILFLSEDAGLLQKIRLFRQNGITLLGYYCPTGMYAVACKETSLSGLCALGEKLMQNGIVEDAGPVTVSAVTEQSVPDDPFGGNEKWNDLQPAGNNWGLEAIGARQAWDYDAYFNHICVGVIDAGFNLNHEDLFGRIGFPSNRYSRQNRASAHGDHVAGIIGAKRNNSKGTAGICNDVTLMCVDCIADSGQIWNTDLHMIFGFMDAVKMGAKVLNFSLGNSGSIASNMYVGSNFVAERNGRLCSMLISSLLGKGYDFLVVQSAGNGNEDNVPIDAYYNGAFCSVTAENAKSIRRGVSVQDILDRIIVVAAAENRGNGNYMQAYFSDVGDQVSIAAPGMNIYSCDAGSTDYCIKSGTSMACPMVTGVAALVWSIDENFSGADVKKIICDPANTRGVARQRTDYKVEGLAYRDYPLVSADLSVKAALMQSGNVGRVTGTFTGDGETTGKATQAFCRQNGITAAFDLLGDGSVDFVAPAGDAEVTVSDGEGHILFAGNVTVVQGETLVLNNQPT